MTTRPFSYAPEPWTHDWDCRTVGNFGDVGYGNLYGIDVTILADSAEQAEQRALTYIDANYDDPTPLHAEANPTPVAPGRYKVRVTWRDQG